MKVVKVFIVSIFVLVLSACNSIEEIEEESGFELTKHNYSVETIVYDIDLDSLQIDSVIVHEINDEMILNAIFMPNGNSIVDLDDDIIIDNMKFIIDLLNDTVVCSDVKCKPFGDITQFTIELSDSNSKFNIKFSQSNKVVFVQSIEGNDVFFFSFTRGTVNEFDEIINSILNEYNQ